MHLAILMDGAGACRACRLHEARRAGVDRVTDVLVWSCQRSRSRTVVCLRSSHSRLLRLLRGLPRLVIRCQ